MNTTFYPATAHEADLWATEHVDTNDGPPCPSDALSRIERCEDGNWRRIQLVEEGRPILIIGEAEPVPRAFASYSVDNETFASAIFHTLPADAIAVGCVRRSFAHQKQRTHWVASELTTVMSHRSDVYVSSSSYRLDENGHLDMSRASFAGMHCFVFGDCGGRIESERLAGMEFSWELETPSQELQVGIIFDEPIQDPAIAVALLCAATRAGICYETGTLPPSHWALLPGRSAAPSLMEPPSQVYAWNPTVRWSLETFCKAFELDLKVSRT